jgi:hypothetical protein
MVKETITPEERLAGLKKVRGHFDSFSSQVDRVDAALAKVRQSIKIKASAQWSQSDCDKYKKYQQNVGECIDKVVKLHLDDIRDCLSDIDAEFKKAMHHLATKQQSSR